MSYRTFARLEFERALGHAANKALKAALTENRFDAEPAWPTDNPFQRRYDVAALSAERAQA